MNTDGKILIFKLKRFVEFLEIKAYCEFQKWNWGERISEQCCAAPYISDHIQTFILVTSSLLFQVVISDDNLTCFLSPILPLCQPQRSGSSLKQTKNILKTLPPPSHPIPPTLRTPPPLDWTVSEQLFKLSWFVCEGIKREMQNS